MNKKFKLFLSSLWIALELTGAPLSSDTYSPFQMGHLFFLIQQGEHEQGIKLYQEYFQKKGKHDYDVLHRIGLGILDYGSRQKDPEIQLLTLFGASVAAHEDVYYILEESLQNYHAQIQLVALNALARIQNERADRALLKALGSSSLLVRYEALQQLCKKKHPQAAVQTQSFMYKMPRALYPIYAPLFAMIGDELSIRTLRKLLSHSSEKVRISVILNAAKYGRDDLLPQIRQQVVHLHFAQQEACAYALGKLKDDQALAKLKNLTTSQYLNVSLAAHLALYHLGHEEAAIQAIEQAAQQGELFAIAALGEIPHRSDVLLRLLNNTSLQIRLNAVIALLNQRHPAALPYVPELVIHDKRDLGFIAVKSPGKSLQAWKITPSASQLLQDDMDAYEEHLDFKEEIVQHVYDSSDSYFLTLAHQIFTKQQKDLVPLIVELLEEKGTAEAIQCLKEHQQQLGSPFVRQYCNLALYRLQEPGPYGQQLRQWVKNQSQSEFIRFEPFTPWEVGKEAYTLTPEETSKLLIESFEAFAIHQDVEGIETLLEAIATGHSKNKYALAGLLLRATE